MIDYLTSHFFVRNVVKITLIRLVVTFLVLFTLELLAVTVLFLATVVELRAA